MVFQCRTRLCGWCNLVRDHSQQMFYRFNAARGFVGGATFNERQTIHCRKVSMPHAALWVVQPHGLGALAQENARFQCRTRLCGWCNTPMYRALDRYMEVSMPHAALWVVQHDLGLLMLRMICLFQCRTRLCGWCNPSTLIGILRMTMFQCRTRLCGWCNSSC